MFDRKIIYTDHATIRKFERDISDKDIGTVLKNPDYVISSIDGRKIATKKIGNRTVNVVYKDKMKYIIVITIY